ncbi:MAG TPA: molybdopterin-dependent oxidoreductase, partial [Nitrospiraceae bacterium]|nr:molybdopterin-dependent oxidoreductase [Nitrospiraceae bacterium]
YVFQKFMRLVIGTNNIDSSARYGQVNGVRALRRVQGSPRWTVTFEDIVSANALLLVGTNVTETNPITGLKVKEAVKKHGASLLTIEALVPAVGKISNIANLSTHDFAGRPDQFGMMVLALIKAVMDEHLIDAELTQRAPAYVKAIGDALQALSWETIEAATCRPSATWCDAARVFAAAKRAIIVVGQGVLRHPGGLDVTTNLLDLLLLTGHHGRPGCGLATLAEENNDQGAIEMGAVAEFLPGPSDLTDRPARERLVGLWKEELPKSAGRTLMGILEEAKKGAIKALYVVGENPIGSLPPLSGAKEALQQCEFLVCQELFMTETAALAHVVFPAASYAEKEGTFTNTEGLVQPVRQAIDTIGESRPDWEILSALSVLMGYPIEYGDAKEIFKEIRSVIPGYALLGPVPISPRPDVDVVARYLRDGYAEDLAARYRVPGERHEARGDRREETFTLVLSQSLFHSGKFSTRAKGLLDVEADGKLALNSIDAGKLNIAEGDRVRVVNARGEMITTVTLRDRLPEGLVTFPEHFDEQALSLMPLTIDDRTGVPYYRAARVKIERVP